MRLGGCRGDRPGQDDLEPEAGATAHRRRDALAPRSPLARAGREEASALRPRPPCQALCLREEHREQDSQKETAGPSVSWLA